MSRLSESVVNANLGKRMQPAHAVYHAISEDEKDKGEGTVRFTEKMGVADSKGKKEGTY